LLLELSKFAEMSGDVQQKAELQRQYKDALKEKNEVGDSPRTDGKIKTLRVDRKSLTTPLLTPIIRRLCPATACNSKGFLGIMTLGESYL
jgi:hypothetical protein